MFFVLSPSHPPSFKMSERERERERERQAGRQTDRDRERGWGWGTVGGGGGGAIDRKTETDRKISALLSIPTSSVAHVLESAM